MNNNFIMKNNRLFSNIRFKLDSRIKKLFNYIYSLFISKGDYIVLNAWIEQFKRDVIHRNFGDELSYYLLKEITGKVVVNYYDIPVFHKTPNILFIGSLVERLVNSDTIIWGAGCIVGGSEELKAIPKKVHAVRGKLTRQYLLEHNVDCPEVYGDPALLLPYVFQPTSKKKYKLGIIPHHSEIHLPWLAEFVKKNLVDIHLINLVNYESWKGVIEEICECEYILSSSLHGLIIADAYKIPNLWIKLSNKLIGGDFKFLDYFSGVDRKDTSPFFVNSNTSLEDIQNKLDEYIPINYDVKRFIASSPFPIKLDI